MNKWLAELPTTAARIAASTLAASAGLLFSHSSRITATPMYGGDDE